MPVLAVWRGSE